MTVIENTLLRIVHANTFKTRLLGLMFQKIPPENQAYFLEPCKSIHMFFMRFDLDVMVLNKDYEIIALFKALKPGKTTPYFREARCFVEMKTGSIDTYGFALGQKITTVEM